MVHSDTPQEEEGRANNRTRRPSQKEKRGAAKKYRWVWGRQPDGEGGTTEGFIRKERKGYNIGPSNRMIDKRPERVPRVLQPGEKETISVWPPNVHSAPRKVPFGHRHRRKGPKKLADKNQYERIVNASEEVIKDTAYLYYHHPGRWARCLSTHTCLSEQSILRKLIMIQTVDAVIRGSYHLPDGTQVFLPKEELLTGVTQTIAYNSTDLFPKHKEGEAAAGAPRASKQKLTLSTGALPPPSCQTPPQSPGLKPANPLAAPPIEPTKVILVPIDILTCAAWATGLSERVCVVSPASMSNPGGGYVSGMSALEEQLCRRSSLFCCLADPWGWDTNRKWTYPLSEFGGAFSPFVQVFRGTEVDGYPFLPRSYSVSVVSVASYSTPPTEETTKGVQIAPKIASLTRKKMFAILEMARRHRQEVVVIPPWGCGIHGNPAEHIAALFRELLEKEFKDCFKTVIFSVPAKLQFFGPAFESMAGCEVFDEIPTTWLSDDSAGSDSDGPSLVAPAPSGKPDTAGEVRRRDRVGGEKMTPEEEEHYDGVLQSALERIAAFDKFQQEEEAERGEQSPPAAAAAHPTSPPSEGEGEKGGEG